MGRRAARARPADPFWQWRCLHVSHRAACASPLSLTSPSASCHCVLSSWCPVLGKHVAVYPLAASGTYVASISPKSARDCNNQESDTVVRIGRTVREGQRRRRHFPNLQRVKTKFCHGLYTLLHQCPRQHAALLSPGAPQPVSVASRRQEHSTAQALGNTTILQNDMKRQTCRQLLSSAALTEQASTKLLIALSYPYGMSVPPHWDLTSVKVASKGS
jgi:hypothetical protein